MKCQACGNEQESGKFCGSCGSPMEATIEKTAPVSEPVHREEPNVHVEKVKDRSKQYWGYFLQYLKRPSAVFGRGESEFVNGLISIGVLALFVSLTMYAMTRSITSDFFGSDFYSGPGFFSILFSGIIFTILFSVCAVLVLFLISRFFGPGYSFKEMTGVYGVHLIPSIVLMAVSLLLVLLKAYVYSGLFMSLSLTVALLLMPLYLISALLTKKSAALDPLYGYFIYIVLSLILFSLIVGVLADSTMGEYLDDLPGFYY
ncbi:DUF6574 domain-containing protein [Domibacillus epiphyticus]|uniref:Zinc ribbon domain-containing protein n=1 Tax=Domibacillus epiphyticus TaxID=1714355 RepID=A0A1V2A6V1_9BACI|nr:DUF6574 domain-containing protein [Domibacillus epiphyticus]OMP66650.1 hypothetical protein BTO28_11445 [Domibacillus epiphyticus]